MVDQEIDKHGVFDDKDCWTNLVSKRERKKNRTQILSVHLDHHIVATVNDSPLIPIPYPSNNALHRSQIDNFIVPRPWGYRRRGKNRHDLKFILHSTSPENFLYRWCRVIALI